MKYILFSLVVLLFPMAQVEAKGRDMVCKVRGGNTIIYTDTARLACPDGMDEIVDVKKIEALRKVQLIVCGEQSTTLVARYCGAGAVSDAYASLGYAAGKVYFEATLHIAKGQTEPGTWTSVGIVTKPNLPGGLFVPSGGDAGFSPMAINTWSGPLKPEDMKDGDTVGVAMDMERKKVEFYHNSKKLLPQPMFPGKSVTLQKKETYFADFSVSAPADSSAGDATDTWTVNFGAKPFKYALPKDYEPYLGALTTSVKKNNVAKPVRPSRRSLRVR